MPPLKEQAFPVAIALLSLALASALHDLGVIPASPVREMVAAFVGVFVCWVIAVLTLRRGDSH